MKLRSILLGSFVVAVAGVHTGNAQGQITAPTPTYLFDAVTQYAVYNNTLYVTGVQHGASATSTISAGGGVENGGAETAAAAACEKQLAIAVNRPGRVSVGVYVGGLGLSGCVLTQLP